MAHHEGDTQAYRACTVFSSRMLVLMKVISQRSPAAQELWCLHIRMGGGGARSRSQVI